MTDAEETARRSISPARLTIGLLIFALLLFLSWFGSVGKNVPGHWYSVVPPLVAVILAFVTGKLMLSLGLGVISGAVLFKLPSFFQAAAPPVAASETVSAATRLILGFSDGLFQSIRYAFAALFSVERMLIVLFVGLILAMISAMIKAGGFQAVVEWLVKMARTSRSTELATFVMGLAIFIDDYANTMIVGSTMRNLTDRFQISREKLAFLVDATSAPVAGLAIVSTWVGYEVSLFDHASVNLKLGLNGYAMLFSALPYRFYCIAMLLFVFINALTRKDFGPMRVAQKRAREKGQLSHPDGKPMTSASFSVSEPDSEATANFATVVIPLSLLFILLFSGLYFSGLFNLAEKNPVTIFYPVSFTQAISHSNSARVLAFSAFIGLVAALITGTKAGKIGSARILAASVNGLKSSLLPIAILVLAWSLKATCDDLQTGNFLVHTIGKELSPFVFPALLFLIASMVSFGTGTSWGTMAILIPIGVAMAHKLDGGTYGIITVISLGAVLDGSIFGDHCSPISDTTIMSSIASSCDHLHHVRTQVPYSLLVGAIAVVVGYLPAAFGLPPLWSVLGIIVVLALIFWRIKR